MPDYKAIHGKTVQHVASDLDNAEGEGQIWFNTTSKDYKTIVKVAGSWATGGALNTGRTGMGNAGTTHGGILAFGGSPGGAPGHAETEEWTKASAAVTFTSS